MFALTRSCPQSITAVSLRHGFLYVFLKGVHYPPPTAPLPTVTPISHRAASAAWRRKEVVNVVTGIQYHADILETSLWVM